MDNIVALADLPDCVAHELVLKGQFSGDPEAPLPKVGIMGNTWDAAPEPGVPREVQRMLTLVAQKHPKMIPMGAFDATIMKRLKAEPTRGIAMLDYVLRLPDGDVPIVSAGALSFSSFIT